MPRLPASLLVIGVLSAATAWAQPAVVSSNPTSATTNAASLSFSVVFSVAVTGVDATDFALGSTGVSGASITGVSGSGTTYTVTVNTGSGDGSIRVNVVDDDSIIDGGSAPLGGVGAANGNFTGTAALIDKTAPTVMLTTASGATVSGSFLVTVSINEPTSDFVLSDITVGNGSAGSLIGGGTFFTFVVTPAADGNVTVNVGAGVLTDAAGNGNTASNTVTVAADLTAPSVTVTPSDTSITGTSVSFAVVFSEAVTGFDSSSDVTVNVTGLTTGAVTITANSATNYTVAVAGITGSGTLSLTVNAGAATDGIGNANAAATSATVTVTQTSDGGDDGMDDGSDDGSDDNGDGGSDDNGDGGLDTGNADVGVTGACGGCGGAQALLLCLVGMTVSARRARRSR